MLARPCEGWSDANGCGVGVTYSVNNSRYTSGSYSNRMFGPRFGTEVADLFIAAFDDHCDCRWRTRPDLASRPNRQ
jgi:hypothetical protein